MMRSLFSGVSGLRNHQTRMDVIGNNISNVNTLGFKKSTVTFADLYSQTVTPASGPSGLTGGTNPKQIGLGSALGAIATVHSPGSTQYTGAPLDVAISGDGFFCIRTPEGEFYTRSGNFSLDMNGNLVTTPGAYVQGFNVVYTLGNQALEKTSDLSKVAFKNFNIDETTSWERGANFNTALSGVYSFGNINAAGQIEVFREGFSLGFADIMNDTTSAVFNPHTGTTAAPNKYSVTITDDMGNVVGKFSIEATGAYDNATNGIVADLESGFASMSVRISNNDGFVAGANRGNIFVDANKYTNVSIDEKGAVIAQLIEDVPADPTTGSPAMKKGSKVIIGYISLANFFNPAGLEKIGNNLYSASANSGAVMYGEAGQFGFGSLSPSSLEMSNVDLSEEMVNMIITQRGFQANSRIITTSDQILEELVNLKR